MPYKIEYREKTNGILATYFGIVTEQDTVNSRAEIFSNPKKYNKLKYAIADYTDTIRINISASFLFRLIDSNKIIAANNKDMIFAFVLANDFSFGLARMWQLLSGYPDSKIRLFRSIAEAEAWISENVNKRKEV
jgi:hypothetical protein